MSNTDGEDYKRRQRHNAAIRLLEDGDEEYKVNCICTLIESQEELASLREQFHRYKNAMVLKEDQLAKKEEENRELLDKIKRHIQDEMDKLEDYNHEYFTLEELLKILSA